MKAKWRASATVSKEKGSKKFDGNRRKTKCNSVSNYEKSRNIITFDLR